MQDNTKNINTTAATPQKAQPHFPEQVTGMYILAKALKNIGIDTIYGLVGIPITEAAYISSASAMSNRPEWQPPPTATSQESLEFS